LYLLCDYEAPNSRAGHGELSPPRAAYPAISPYSMAVAALAVAADMAMTATTVTVAIRDRRILAW
jgi:hypothetical protein